MGSHATIYALVALAIAAICLAAGFFWGRSDLAARVEQAVEKEHVSLDAREFAMRQQLDDAFAELARLRPLAEELGRVQERLKREQSKYERMKAEFHATVNPGAAPAAEEVEPEPSKPVESADDAIQKLLQSLEVFNAPEGTAPQNNAPQELQPALSTFVDPVVALPPIPASPEPAPVPSIAAQPVPPAPMRAQAESQAPSKPAPSDHRKAAPVAPGARPAASQPAKAAQPAPAKTAPQQPSRAAAVPPAKPGQKVDEWQEFARQLEALTGRKK